MNIPFCGMTINQITPNTMIHDRNSNTYFRPCRIEAIEGGSLERKTINGQPLLDPFGKLVLQKSLKTTGPYYFRIVGVNLPITPSSKPLVDLIVPFNGVGQHAYTSELDVYA